MKTNWDDDIQRVLWEHFDIDWSGEMADSVPSSGCSQQFQALRDLVDRAVGKASEVTR